MYRVEYEGSTDDAPRWVEIPDTDPRWRCMSKSARLQFVAGRLAGLSDEDAFDGLGLPVKPLEEPRWLLLSAGQQVEFLEVRLKGLSEAEAFVSFGHPAPVPDPADTPDEESAE